MTSTASATTLVTMTDAQAQFVVNHTMTRVIEFHQGLGVYVYDDKHSLSRYIIDAEGKITQHNTVAYTEGDLVARQQLIQELAG